MPTARITMKTSKEAAIFGRVFAEGRHALTPELARHILAIGFSGEDEARMHNLSVKNQEGRISRDELEELDSYILVTDLLAILQSKARKLLKTVKGT